MLLYVSLFLFMEDKEYSEYSEELERVTLSRLPRREELLAMTAVDMDCFVGEVLLAMTGGRPPPNDGWIALS